MPLDFRGQNLRGKDFRGRTDLIGADFTGADLRNADFQGVNLEGAHFEKARLKSARFDHSVLISASFAAATTGRAGWRVIAAALAANLLVPALSLLNASLLAELAHHATTEDAEQISWIAFTCAVVTVQLALLLFGVAVAVAVAVAFGAFAGAVAGALAGSFAGALAGSFAGALAGAFGLAGACAGTLAGAVLAAVRYFDVASLAPAPWLILWSIWLNHRVRKRAPGLEWFYTQRLRLSSIAASSFRHANLTRVDFTHTKLNSANFSHATLTQTNFRDTPLQNAWFTDERFRQPDLQQLLQTGKTAGITLANRNLSGFNLAGANLANLDLSHGDLTNASLEGADLTGANLSEVQALGTNFSRAKLTGACLRNWHLDSQTILTGAECEYFYLQPNQQERRPHQQGATFPAGVFEKLFAEVTDTIQLLMGGQGDRAAWAAAFSRLMREYPEINPDQIVSIKRLNDIVQVELEAPAGIDKEGVAETFHTNYAKALADSPAAAPSALPPAAAAALIPTAEPASKPRKARVFISYAHEDANHCQALIDAAAALPRTGLAEFWSDRKIPPGDPWQAALDHRLQDCDFALLLISTDFVNSQYCMERELTALTAQTHTRVIPILVRDGVYDGLPFMNLQHLPKDGTPIANRRPRDKAWAEVVRELRAAIADWQENTRARTAMAE